MNVRTFTNPIEPDGVPEFFMGVRGVVLDGAEATTTLDSGPWLTWDGLHLTPGSLGVLFDNILAYPILSGASADAAMVSSEITVEVLRPLGPGSGTLAARGVLLTRDERSAFASGEVRDGDGRLMAVGSQRGSFVPAIEPPAYDYRSVAPPTQTSRLTDLVWPDGDIPELDGDGRLAVPVTARLENHMHCLHGGMSMLLAEWSAVSAARRAGSPLAAASIRIFFARPIPQGSIATFETSVLHSGRSSCLVSVVGRTESGKCGVAATVSLH